MNEKKIDSRDASIASTELKSADILINSFKESKKD